MQQWGLKQKQTLEKHVITFKFNYFLVNQGVGVTSLHESSLELNFTKQIFSQQWNNIENLSSTRFDVVLQNYEFSYA